jgi:hypothetical protein
MERHEILEAMTELKLYGMRDCVAWIGSGLRADGWRHTSGSPSPPWNLSAVPFKYHAEHRHHIPKTRYRVTNRSEYDASLKRRGSLTVWFTDEAIQAWRAEPRTTPGGQPHCHVRFQGVWTQKSTRFFSSRLVSLMQACTVEGGH